MLRRVLAMAGKKLLLLACGALLLRHALEVPGQGAVDTSTSQVSMVKVLQLMMGSN